MTEEKRAQARATIKIEVMFKECGAFTRAYMLNVSNGGLFIKTDDPLPLESPVVLKLKLPDEPEMLEIAGKVVWNNPSGQKNSFPCGMGIQFVDMRPDHAEILDRFVDTYRKDIEDHALL